MLNYKFWIVGIVCIGIGWVLHSLTMPKIEELIRYEEQEHGDILRNPFSFSTVEEMRIDEDKNGVFDEWLVTVGIKSPNISNPKAYKNMEKDKYHFIYKRQEYAENGKVDTIKLSFMEKTMSYKHFDDNDDGEMDAQLFSLSDITNNSDYRYLYYDLNLDGRIDFFVNRLEKDYPYVIINDQIHYVLMEEGGNWVEGHYVAGSDGVPKKIFFDRNSGNWNFEG